METKLLKFIEDIQDTIYQDKAVKGLILNNIMNGDIIHIGDAAKDIIIGIYKDLITMFDKSLDIYDDTYDHSDVLDKLKEHKKEDKEERLIRLSEQFIQLEKEYNDLINELNEV